MCMLVLVTVCESIAYCIEWLADDLFSEIEIIRAVLGNLGALKQIQDPNRLTILVNVCYIQARGDNPLEKRITHFSKWPLL